jgi:hypothetical protein
MSSNPTPQVFLSSTIRDLERLRAKIAKDVEARGWTEWRWESRNVAGGVESQIWSGLEGSAFVVCVLGSRYGSFFQSESIATTEWELGLARQLRKPLAIYWIASDERHRAQDSLGRLLEGMDDLRIAKVSVRSLRGAISRDLDAWAAGEYKRPRFFASRRLSTRTRGNAIDVDESLDQLATIQSLREREQYLDAEQKLRDLKPMLCGYASPHAALDKRRVARDFLDLAANVAHVRGAHTEARANAAAAVQIGWHLPDAAGRWRSASAASGIYSRVSPNVALAANDYALDRATDPIDRSAILDSRAAILLNVDRAASAVALSQEAVSMYGKRDNVLGYLQVRLATALLATKERRRWVAAEEAFDAARSLVRHHPLSRVMLHAAEVPYLVDARQDRANASEHVRRAVDDCRRFGLEDPLPGLATLSSRYCL